MNFVPSIADVDFNSLTNEIGSPGGGVGGGGVGVRGGGGGVFGRSTGVFGRSGVFALSGLNLEFGLFIEI